MGVALMDRGAVMGDVSPVRGDSRAVQPRWTCAATNPQAERWAEQNLQRAGYRTYLPLCLVRKRDRVVRSLWHSVLMPLFPGYLFVAIGPDDPWSPVRYSPGVRKLCVYGYRLQFARNGDVEALQAGEEQRRVLQPAVEAWRPGDACRVAAGAFGGQEAVVAELRGSRAVVGLIAAGALSRVVVPVEQLERRT